MKLAAIGEFGLIDRIAARAKYNDSVLIGIGDDAAATRTGSGMLNLITSDMLVEGVHFDLTYSAPRTLGRKSLAVNLSDIAAMGGHPRYFLLSLAIPPSLPVDFLDEYCAGLLQCADEHGTALVGGDTCATTGGLVISITLVGEQTSECTIKRNGARPGDLLFVTGTLGDSALGLRMLQQGKRDGFAIQRHLDPTPRTREGIALAEAGLPTAMIDVSDGLTADLGHIMELSRVGASIRFDEIPRSDFFSEHALGSCADIDTLLIAGGEDYELLFTVSPGNGDAVNRLLADLGAQATCIGEITGEPGLKIVTGNGRIIDVSRTGYNHFPVTV